MFIGSKYEGRIGGGPSFDFSRETRPQQKVEVLLIGYGGGGGGSNSGGGSGGGGGASSYSIPIVLEAWVNQIECYDYKLVDGEGGEGGRFLNDPALGQSGAPGKKGNASLLLRKARSAAEEDWQTIREIDGGKGGGGGWSSAIKGAPDNGGEPGIGTGGNGNGGRGGEGPVPGLGPRLNNGEDGQPTATAKGGQGGKSEGRTGIHAGGGGGGGGAGVGPGGDGASMKDGQPQAPKEGREGGGGGGGHGWENDPNNFKGGKGGNGHIVLTVVGVIP